MMFCNGIHLKTVLAHPKETFEIHPLNDISPQWQMQLKIMRKLCTDLERSRDP